MVEESLSLLSFLQQEEITTADAFLQAALKRIVAAYDNVQAAAVHRAEGSRMSVWAAAPDTTEDLTTNPTLPRVLETGAPTMDETQQQILVPLRDKSSAFAVLLLTYEGEPPLLAHVMNLANQLSIGVQHLQILEARERAATMMRHFNDWIVASSADRDEQSVLERSAQILKQATRAERVAIATLQDDQHEPVFTVQAAVPLQLMATKIVDPQRQIVRLLTEEQQALQVDDVTRKRIPATLLQFIDLLENESAFIFPMFDSQNQLLGLCIMACEMYHMPEDLLAMAQTIVSQMTINVQKSRLLRETQTQAAQMQRLTTFAEAMQASLHMPDLLEILLERLPYLIPVDYAAVLIYDRKAEALRVPGLLHDGHPSVSPPGAIVEPDSDTVAEHVWKTQEAIWINALQDTWTWQHPYISSLQTMLVSPLTSNGVRIGVLEIGSMHSNRYSQMDMVAFEQISNQLAIGLANAEAYFQSQQLARNKILANDIVGKLQRQMEVEDILRITATELGQALGARRARIRLGMMPQQKNGEQDS